MTAKKGSFEACGGFSPGRPGEAFEDLRFFCSAKGGPATVRSLGAGEVDLFGGKVSAKNAGRKSSKKSGKR